MNEPAPPTPHPDGPERPSRPTAPSARRVGRRGVLLAGGLAGLVGLVGCDHRDGTSVDRDTFIAVYVDLRATALRSGQAPLDDSARARILAAHGVEERDLRRFADDHGADLAFVRDLWNEVEARFDSIRPTLPRPPD